MGTNFAVVAARVFARCGIMNTLAVGAEVHRANVSIVTIRTLRTRAANSCSTNAIASTRQNARRTVFNREGLAFRCWARIRNVHRRGRKTKRIAYAFVVQVTIDCVARKETVFFTARARAIFNFKEASVRAVF